MSTELQVSPNSEIAFSEKDLKNASAILSLLNGKADSSCRLFKKQIIVDQSCLESLNQEVINKLQLHNVSEITTSIDVVFSNRHLLTFKSWLDFCSHNFQTENDKIQSVILQWDFFIKIENYQLPQRHTLNVRIASAPKPSDVFKVLLSGGFDDEHDIDIQGSTMIARVDFINNTLAEELLNVVSKWNELCESAYNQKGLIRRKLYLHRTALANITEFFSVFSVISILAIVFKIFNVLKFVAINISNLTYLALILIPLSNLLKVVGKFFGKKLYDKLSGIMDTHVFNISRGDGKEIKRIEKMGKYKKEIFLFFVNVIFSILLSIIFFLLEK